MKKENPFRKLLGLSQSEMALLLNVGKSHWSMFELGKRDLPLHAKVLLGEMLKHLKEGEPLNKALAEQQQLENIQQLKKLKEENAFKQFITTKKTAALQKKHDANVKKLEQMAFLEHRNRKNNLPEDIIPKIIAGKAKHIMEQGLGAALLIFQIKQQVLQYEEMLINTALKNTGKS